MPLSSSAIAPLVRKSHGDDVARRREVRKLLQSSHAIECIPEVRSRNPGRSVPGGWILSRCDATFVVVGIVGGQPHADVATLTVVLRGFGDAETLTGL
jgi:hypothetical protein